MSFLNKTVEMVRTLAPWSCRRCGHAFTTAQKVTVNSEVCDIPREEVYFLCKICAEKGVIPGQPGKNKRLQKKR